ncbi:AEC family transporter [Serinibacter arcticus]|uniref:Auxin Efflux Carrier n=1 Tax=Serinibacter arcticus TaxID=1655435 RepID=A0A4Z1E574_9MICO|nr:AEC family transporter [Serinibacter arcticus]TGO05633.1 Auxin Efflux Carrier [Serinibacter arcticus]
MTGVLAGFALIGAIIAVGYLVGRSGVLGEDASSVLSRLSFFVGAPALLYVTLARSDVGALVDARSLVSYGTSAAMIVVYVLVARFAMRRPAGETVIGGLSAGYVNAGNLGIPIAVYALGGAAAAAPTMIFQLVLLAPASFIVLDLLENRGQGRRLRNALAPLRNPILLASVAGVVSAATHWEPPTIVMAPIETLGGVAVPAMLLAFGISLRGSPLPGRSPVRAQLGLVVVLKSFVQPALAWGLGAAVGLTGEALLAAVVIAGLPTAQNVFTYAVRYDRGVVLARESVLVTTILSVPVVLVAAAVLA